MSHQPPDLRTPFTALLQANNRGWASTTGPIYDPLDSLRRERNIRAQLACSLAQKSGTRISLDASGRVHEAPDEATHTRLNQVLREKGRHPKSLRELDAWLKQADASMAPDQRLAAAMVYVHKHGQLPPTHETDDEGETDEEVDTESRTTKALRARPQVMGRPTSEDAQGPPSTRHTLRTDDTDARRRGGVHSMTFRPGVSSRKQSATRLPSREDEDARATVASIRRSLDAVARQLRRR